MSEARAVVSLLAPRGPRFSGTSPATPEVFRSLRHSHNAGLDAERGGDTSHGGCLHIRQFGGCEPTRGGVPVIPGVDQLAVKENAAAIVIFKQRRRRHQSRRHAPQQLLEGAACKATVTDVMRHQLSPMS